MTDTPINPTSAPISPTNSAQPTPRHSTPSSPHERTLLTLAFRLYKSLVSPIFHAIAPSRCLYLPTCSEYAYTAIHRFGLMHGSGLALRRFARCHPWGSGGLDPVPDPVPAPVPERSSIQPPSTHPDRTPADHLP
jgi:hypothetical protein